MYKKELRKRGDINDAITQLFNRKYPNKHINNSLKYYEDLNRELEARKTKSARILYRKQLLENQNKMNYTNEVNRIRGILSQNDTRFPIGTREKLKERIEKLKELGAQISDEIK